MAYNKTSEERKWNYWKEQEEKDDTITYYFGMAGI